MGVDPFNGGGGQRGHRLSELTDLGEEQLAEHDGEDQADDDRAAAHDRGAGAA
jgi:hypothetical protein